MSSFPESNRRMVLIIFRRIRLGNTPKICIPVYVLAVSDSGRISLHHTPCKEVAPARTLPLRLSVTAFQGVPDEMPTL
jgi:hypothetical protein